MVVAGWYTTIFFAIDGESRKTCASKRRGFAMPMDHEYYASQTTRGNVRVWTTRSVVQDDAQEGAVDFEGQLAVVFDEAQLLELVQEDIHARARRAHHLRE